MFTLFLKKGDKRDRTVLKGQKGQNGIKGTKGT
jgi:hypothetical protein